MEGGYDAQLDLHYDKKSKIGNTTVYVVAPKITPEENQRRWDLVCEVASSIVENIIARGGFMNKESDK